MPSLAYVTISFVLFVLSFGQLTRAMPVDPTAVQQNEHGFHILCESSFEVKHKLQRLHDIGSDKAHWLFDERTKLARATNMLASKLGMKECPREVVEKFSQIARPIVAASLDGLDPAPRAKKRAQIASLNEANYKVALERAVEQANLYKTRLRKLAINCGQDCEELSSRVRMADLLAEAEEKFDLDKMVIESDGGDPRLTMLLAQAFEAEWQERKARMALEQAVDLVNKYKNRIWAQDTSLYNNDPGDFDIEDFFKAE